MISWAMHGEPHGPKKGGDPKIANLVGTHNCLTVAGWWF